MMNLHLAEISANVAAGAHAVLTIDGAGWHKARDKLRVPDNVTLLHLPPYRPEVNPGRKRLGLPARQQTQQPRVRDLRGYRRRLLRRVNLAHGTARTHHLNRHTRMGMCHSMKPGVLQVRQEQARRCDRAAAFPYRDGAQDFSPRRGDDCKIIYQSAMDRLLHADPCNGKVAAVIRQPIANRLGGEQDGCAMEAAGFSSEQCRSRLPVCRFGCVSHNNKKGNA